RLVAACELLAVIALLVPQATGIVPVLTPLAALGLAVIMVGAGLAHARLREPRTVTANAVILLVCLAVAVGRFAGA
ncbi:MAG: DoxX family protein, partial [Pseudonocardiaceae bacterium]